MDVHLLDRGRIEADVNFVLDGSTVATASEPNPDLRHEAFLVWSLVVDHPEGTVLCDTGSHPEAGNGYWPTPLYEAFAHVDAAGHDLADDLEAAGYGIDDVDAVVMSHLHLDTRADCTTSREPTRRFTSTNGRSGSRTGRARPTPGASRTSRRTSTGG